MLQKSNYSQHKVTLSDISVGDVVNDRYLAGFKCSHKIENEIMDSMMNIHLEKQMGKRNVQVQQRSNNKVQQSTDLRLRKCKCVSSLTPSGLTTHTHGATLPQKSSLSFSWCTITNMNTLSHASSLRVTSTACFSKVICISCFVRSFCRKRKKTNYKPWHVMQPSLSLWLGRKLKEKKLRLSKVMSHVIMLGSRGSTRGQPTFSGITVHLEALLQVQDLEHSANTLPSETTGL